MIEVSNGRRGTTMLGRILLAEGSLVPRWLTFSHAGRSTWRGVKRLPKPLLDFVYTPVTSHPGEILLLCVPCTRVAVHSVYRNRGVARDERLI